MNVNAKEATNISDPGVYRRMVLITVTLLIMLGGFGLWFRLTHPSYDRYTPVLQAMRDHHLTADDIGRIDLTKQFPGLIPGNMAQITWLDGDNFRAMFPLLEGRDAAVSGLMYTSRLLTDDDTHPRNSSIHFDQRIIRVGAYENLIVDEKLNDHWYRVSYKMH